MAQQSAHFALYTVNNTSVGISGDGIPGPDTVVSQSSLPDLINLLNQVPALGTKAWVNSGVFGAQCDGVNANVQYVPGVGTLLSVYQPWASELSSLLSAYVPEMPSKPLDAAVAALIPDTGTATGAALAAGFVSQSQLSSLCIIPQLAVLGGQDCTSIIQAAASKAQAARLPLLLLPSANGLPYKMTSTLQVWSGARIIGQGAVLDFQTDHTATGVGFFIGQGGAGVSDVCVTGLRLICSNASARNGVYGVLSIFDSTDVLLEDVWVGDASAASGGESAGIYVQNTTDLRIVRPRVQNTLADGIHLSRGTTDAVLDQPVVIGAQDDGISVVSVKQDGTGPIYSPCQRVQIIQPSVRDSTTLGSGIALVGAQDCVVTGGVIDTVPARVFVVSQANYGGVINPARNIITGLVGKNAASTSQSFLVGNADRTVITGIDISQCPGGGQVLSSTRTKINGSGISSTADQMGVYDDGASSRTIVTGCDLSANGAQSYNIYIGATAGGENTKLGNVPMGTTSFTVTSTAGTAATPPPSNTSGLPTPTASTPTVATTGGAIAAGTYYFKVTAVNSKGETVGSNEVTATTTGTTSTITITWSPIINAVLLQGAGSVQSGNITT